MAEEKDKLKIVSARPLNPRSLRLEFSNGAVCLFDSHRLRGPKFIPLMEEKYFTAPVIQDGNLSWEGLDVVCDARYIYDRSVPYDDHGQAQTYEPTKKDILQERIAMVLFPLMAVSGIIGIVWWYINN